MYAAVVFALSSSAHTTYSHAILCKSQDVTCHPPFDNEHQQRNSHPVISVMTILHSTVSRHNIKITAVFAIASITLNILCNCYSPIFELVGCYDPACFYMAGKAWASGLTPYVDFVDVKGPLLFWIHKMAYQLAPGTTIGILAFHCVSTFMTLLLGYLTARIFIPSWGRAAVATLLCSIFMFAPGAYTCGGQAEELMLPFTAFLIYALCNVMYTGPQRAASFEIGKISLLGFSTGLGAAASFLIKYNVTLTFLTAAILYSGYCLAVGQWRVWLRCYLLWAIAGLLVLIAPFCAYLEHANAFSAFIDVYFNTNFCTYFSNETGMQRNWLPACVNFIESTFSKPENTWACLTCFFAFLPTFNIGKKLLGASPASWIIGACAVVTYVACAPGFWYYVMSCAPFYILACTWLMCVYSREIGMRATWIAAIAICCFTIRVNGNWRTKAYGCIFQHLNKEQHQIEQTINLVPNAKLLYIGCLDYGFGVSGRALPAIPNWMTLNGATMSFKEKQKQGLQSHSADFVLYRSAPIAVTSASQKQFLQLLNDNGYDYICSMNEHSNSGVRSLKLYAKKDIAKVIRERDNCHK